MRKHHRTGAAVALAAALLGPRRARLLAEPIEQRRPRRKTVQRAGLAAKAEGKVSSGIRSLRIRSHPGPLFAPISGIGDTTAIGPIMAPNELERKCGRSTRRPVQRRTAGRLRFGFRIFEFLQSICNIKQRPFRNLDASKFEAGWKTNDDRTQ